MRFYVATGIEHVAQQQAMKVVLEAMGHTISHDWAPMAGLQNDLVDLDPLDVIRNHEGFRSVALHEAEGVRNADAVIVLLPGGAGTHVEIGIALGAGKPVFLIAEKQEDFRFQGGKIPSFYGHPLVIAWVASGRGWKLCIEEIEERLG